MHGVPMAMHLQPYEFLHCQVLQALDQGEQQMPWADASGNECLIGRSLLLQAVAFS